MVHLAAESSSPSGLFVLAASGPELVLRRRLQPMQEQVEQAGLVCSVLEKALRLCGCCSADWPPMGRVLVEQGVGDGWTHADE